MAVGIIAILAETIQQHEAFGCGCCVSIECENPGCWDAEYEFFDCYEHEDCKKSEGRGVAIAKAVYARLQREEFIQ